MPDPSGRQEEEDEARTGGTGGFEICWTGWRGVKGTDILIVENLANNMKQILRSKLILHFDCNYT